METKVTRKLILDTETSGLDFEKDRIIEIACLELVDNIFTGKKYHQYFNPENINISPESENIHGLNNEFLREFNSFDHEIEKFINFMDDSILVIHNAQFDISMINNSLKRCGKEVIKDSQTICTLELAKKKFPGSKNNLNALCRRFGISLEEREKHSAITDCFLLLQVYNELLGGKQRNLKFNSLDKRNSVTKGMNFNDENFTKIELSEEDKAKHSEMLKLLPNNLWQ